MKHVSSELMMQNRQTDALRHVKASDDMSFEKICEKVYVYYEKHMNTKGLCSAYDVGDYFVFSAGDPNVTNYGGFMVSVDKKDGSIDAFDLIVDNLKLLMRSKKLKIPKEYEFKAS